LETKQERKTRAEGSGRNSLTGRGTTADRTDSLNDTSRNTSVDQKGNPENVTELEGATITAYASSLFQRLRLLDGINYK